MKIVAKAITDKGPFREKNEDYFCLNENLGLYIVADGMGGHMAGEVASRMTVEVMKDFIESKDTDSRESLGEDIEDYSKETNLAVEAVRQANRAVHETALNNLTYKGMGTTVTSALIKDNKLSIAHVGDSRAYLVRAGCIEQITNDHSLVWEQLKAGLITEEEAKHSKLSNIVTRSIGVDKDVNIDVEEISLAHGDRLILCTDGITSVLSDDDILSSTLSSNVPDLLCKKLIDQAMERGCRDNMTVLSAYIYNSMLSHLFSTLSNCFRI